MIGEQAKKLIIGMSHFGPLPGDPKFKKGQDLDDMAEQMLLDVDALAAGGATAVMFSNEASQPWMLQNGKETMTAMAYIIGRMHSRISLPFGVHVIWDAEATIDLAVATGADFAWEVFQGAYCSDYGIWDTSAGTYIRQMKRLKIKLLCEIYPESAVPIRKKQIGSSAMGSIRPFGICVAGIKPGVPPPIDFLKEQNYGDSKLIVSTGMNRDNISDYLRVADGAIIGSAFKKDGRLFNSVDYGRVKDLMDIVNGR